MIRIGVASTSNNFYLNQMYSMFYWKFVVIFENLTSNVIQKSEILHLHRWWFQQCFCCCSKDSRRCSHKTHFTFKIFFSWHLIAFEILFLFFGVLWNFFHLCMTWLRRFLGHWKWLRNRNCNDIRYGRGSELTGNPRWQQLHRQVSVKLNL